MPSNRRRSSKKKESYWREQVAGWRASGLSQAEFSRRSDISVNALGNWKRRLEREGDHRRPDTRTAEACEPLLEMLRREVRAGSIINMDETRGQVLKEPGRKNTSNSYMWVTRGGEPERPVVLFHYDPGRGGKVAEEIVRKFNGFLQRDGYAG